MTQSCYDLLSPSSLAEASAESSRKSRERIYFRWFAAATLILGYFLIEHYLSYSLEEELDSISDTMEEAVGSGMLSRRVGFLLLGALGVYGLLRREGRAWANPTLPVILTVALVAWTAASATWSTAPPMTYRRLFVLLCSFLAMLGIARQTTPRDLAWMTMVAAGSFVALGLGVELIHGAFHPWSGEYRFAGTMHPNSQASSCACLCMAAILFSDTDRRARRWSWLLAGAAFVFLWLTGSRTSTAAMLVTLLIVKLVRSRTRVLVLAGPWVLAALAGVLLTSELCGLDLVSKVMDVALMGRAEDASALAGRLPLWNELLPYIAQRPILGYGYGAFWTVEHVNTLSTELSWAIGAAHNAYLELTLDLGVVGAVLAATTVLFSVGQAGRQLRYGDGGYAFAFAMLLFAVLCSFTESAFVVPCFGTELAGCAVCHMVFFAQPEGGLKPETVYG